MPMPRKNGSASATFVPVAYRLLENSTTWMTTGATHAPASSAATAPMVNASTTLPRWPLAGKRGRVLREVDEQDVEHREAEHDEQDRDAQVEPRRRVDRAERAGGQDDDEPEDAVDDRHGGAVGRAEQEPPAARLRLRAGADDRQVDRNHRQDARRQVEREAAEQHEQQNGERAAAFEHAARLDARFRVANEREKVGRALVSARRAGDREVVEQRRISPPDRRRRRRWLRLGLGASSRGLACPAFHPSRT